MSVTPIIGLPTLPCDSAAGNAGSPALRRLQQLIARESGLYFRGSRKSVLSDAVERRRVALGLDNLDQYLFALEVNPDELGNLVDALTVGETAFFRQPRVFAALRNEILPELRSRHERPLRLWSAGCSTGEEAYSLAMTLRDIDPTTSDVVLGTDLNTHAIGRARLGVYALDAVQDVPAEYRERWFERFVDDRGRELVQIHPDIQRLVDFDRHNLVGTWWPDGPWDLVLCQNVLMYFDPAHRRNVLERCVGTLSPNGYLIVSPAELPAEPLFETMRPENRAGVLVYRRR